MKKFLAVHKKYLQSLEFPFGHFVDDKKELVTLTARKTSLYFITRIQSLIKV